MNILLKSAKIVAPATPSLHHKKRDIHIKNGKIEKIAANIALPPNTKEIKKANLHVSLGWLDTSISFGEPGYEERETIANGMDVAGKSGFTDILLNPNTNPVPDSGSDIVFLKDRGTKSATNLHPIGALTVNANGEALAELYDMKSMGAVAFYDYKKPIRNSNLLKIALLYAQNFDGLICSYPEDLAIKGKGTVNEGLVATKLGLKGIPALSEELQIARDLYILEYTEGKLHIPTISTAGAVKLVAEAKKKGLNVTASVALHNLCMEDNVLETFDSDYKVKPPLRSGKDSKALLKGLLNGTIDYVTCDHRPMAIEEKRVEFDNAAFGTIGLESAFGILNGLVGVEEAIKLLTKGRERFGLVPPTFQEGAIANLTLFEPEKKQVFSTEHILSKSKNAIFLNTEIKGTVYGIINNGKMNLNG